MLQKSNIFEKTGVWKDMKNAMFRGRICSVLKIICFSYTRFLTQLISFKMSHGTGVSVPSYLWKRQQERERIKMSFRQNGHFSWFLSQYISLVAVKVKWQKVSYIRVFDKAVLMLYFFFDLTWVLYFLTLDVIISY